MEFTDDPFKDYRYEDPFNIEDPFADVVDSKRGGDPFARPTSAAGFSWPAAAVNGGRVSAPPLGRDPFARADAEADAWAAWPNDNWAADDAWAQPQPKPQPKPQTQPDKADAWSTGPRNTDNWAGKTDNWASKADSWSAKNDNWASEWGKDANSNLNETWPTSTLPAKKEKSPKPVKYAKSLVHTIGGIGRARHAKEKKSKPTEAKSVDLLPSEEQQWAWAAAESKRLEAEAEARRRQEDAELQLALAISRQEK
ncbi:unnamed protein product, partial [Iphiclides podalirius]